MKRIKTYQEFQELENGQKILFVHWHYLRCGIKFPVLVLGRVYSEEYDCEDLTEEDIKDAIELDGFVHIGGKIKLNLIGWKTMEKGDGLLLAYAKPSKENLWEATHLVWKLK